MAAPSNPEGLTLFSQAPVFVLPDLRGVRRSLADWRGHPLLVIFVDPACPHSRALAPGLAALTANPSDVDPLLLLVTTGSVAANEDFVYGNHLRCPVLVQEDREVASAYRAMATPVGYRVDPVGRIVSPLAIGADMLLALARPEGSVPVPTQTPRGVDPFVLRGLEVGTDAPTFTLPGLSGTVHRLEDFRGRRVLLVFFDTASEQCRVMLPAFASLARQAAADPQAPLPVVVATGSLQANAAVVAEHGIPTPWLLQTGTDVSRAYDVSGTPMCYLLDERGIVASPLGHGNAVLAYQAAARAAAPTSGGARDYRARITALVDRPPFGSSVARVYRDAGIRLTQRGDEWQLLRPAFGAVTSAWSAGLGSVAGKWVEALPGLGQFATRQFLWTRVVEALGRDAALRLMPETFRLDVEADMQTLVHADPAERFVFKGTLQRRRGIRLASGPEAPELRGDYLVAERFIAEQVRFRDTTFHLRTYLLLTRESGRVHAWFHREAVCGWAISSRLATSPFEEWVTHPDNVVPDDFPCCLSELVPALGVDGDRLWRGLADTMAAVVGVFAPGAEADPRLQDARCFQFFGVDMLVRPDLTPVLCEVNMMPEMDAHNPRFAAVKDAVLRDGLTVVGLTDQPSHGFRRIRS